MPSRRSNRLVQKRKGEASQATTSRAGLKPPKITHGTLNEVTTASERLMSIEESNADYSLRNDDTTCTANVSDTSNSQLSSVEHRAPFLSDELILTIFQHLRQYDILRVVNLVSRRFRLISRDPLVNTQLIVNARADAFAMVDVRTYATRYASSLRSVKISHLYEFRDYQGSDNKAVPHPDVPFMNLNIFDAVNRGLLPNVTTFVIESCNMSRATAKGWVAKCPNVSQFYSRHLATESFKPFVDAWALALTHVEMIGHDESRPNNPLLNTQYPIFAKFFENRRGTHAARLEYLNVGCAQMSKYEWWVLAVIATGALKTLQVGARFATDGAIQTLVDSAPNLERLELTGGVLLSDESLENIGSLKKLQNVAVRFKNTCELTGPGMDKFFKAIAGKLKRATFENVSGFDDGSAVALVEHQKNLEYLKVWESNIFRRVSPEGVALLKKNFPMLEYRCDHYFGLVA